MQLGIESVAVHVAGVFNVTADHLSRLQLLANRRDRQGERALRKGLFQSIAAIIPTITIDGMASDDGHNAQMERFRCPSESLFEMDFASETAWVVPPDVLIGPVMSFLQALRTSQKIHKVVLLLPERPGASWFHHAKHYRRVRRYVTGSEVFHELSPTGEWKKCLPAKEPWVVLASRDIQF